MHIHLTLAMIVRDEARGVAQTIASALPFVDSWLIADTGSQDGTPDVVARACESKPGRLLRVPFVDFAQARNAVMDAAEPGRVLLWLDADDVLVDGDSLRFMLAVSGGDCWTLRHAWSDGQQFTRATLVRAGSGWRYQGRVHEVLRHPTERETGIAGPSIFQERTPENNARSCARQPWDVEQLREQIAEQPEDSRWREYLARTLAALGRHEDARDTDQTDE